MPNRRDEVLSYLADHHVMTLATHGPQGPWAAAVFYVNEGFNLTFLSSPQSRHGADLTANPSVAAAIHEDSPHWPDIKGVQIEGRARPLTGSDRISAVTRFVKKFPAIRPESAPQLIQAALGRVAWFELAAERCFFVDNSRGFGHRDEIPLA